VVHVASETVRRVGQVALAVLGLLLWLGAMWLLARSTQGADQFGQLYGWLFLFNVAGALTLLVLIVSNLVRLVREYKENVPGSRLKSRMVATFAILSVLPLLLVYYFSVQFMNRGIESWFSVDVEKGLGDALNLSRATLEIQMRDYLDETDTIAEQLAGSSATGLASTMAGLQARSGALEITVFGSNSRMIASMSDRADLAVLARPDEEVMMQIGREESFVGLEPTADGGYRVRTAALIPRQDPFSEQRIVLAIFPISERLSSLANAVQHSYSEYGELSYMRSLLKYSLTLTLTLVLLISLLMAVWGAFFFSRRLVAPIQNLIMGTRSVAKGDFDTQLPLPGNDDMGFLVRSFNEMTRRLAGARELASASQIAVENERAYLAIILGRLSTGVISLERDTRLRTANDAASAILGVGLDEFIGRPFEEAADGHPLLEQFVEAGRRHLAKGDTDWREQLVLHGEVGSRILMCACSALPGEDGKIRGYVVVFDEITALIQAQRDAAWGEVARRLAHEIKNPLTPIQLSAERMRRRFLGRMNEQDAQMMERATRTIVQQVEAMKEMVNAFGEYARAPGMDLASIDLNHLIIEVADLYRSREIAVDIELELDPDVGTVEVDPVRTRQIFHNLLGNAIEALESQSEGRVSVRTKADSEAGHKVVRILVEDNGPGFSKDVVEHVFDPYVTNKPKGTGLGLAIVKKLVEEHGGRIEASNKDDGGARLLLILPADNESRMAMIKRELHSAEYRRERA
jgi:PAS domain S-box-containing protein